MQVRKITSKEDEERKRARNIRWISIILAGIMLFSSLGYFASDITGSKKVSQTYNGLEFTQTDYGTWTFSANDLDFETKFNPSQTENISISLGKNLGDYSNRPLYFGADSAAEISTLGNNELARNIQNFVTKMQASCLTESCVEDNPIKNCSSDNVLIFKSSSDNSSRINADDNCITLEYSQGDEERVADAFLFRIFGVQ